jgi:hypothetical protein
VKDWIRAHPFSVLGWNVMPVALVVFFISAGGGHGDYVLARVLLPFACAVLGSYIGSSILVSLMLLLQWPTYGFLTDRSSSKLLTVSIILITHSALCLWLFTKGGENFR